MKSPLLALCVLLCPAGFAADPALRGGNILACETLNLESMIHAGRLDMLSLPEYYRQQGFPGISFHERCFRNLDDTYIDQVKAAVKSSGRVVTAFLISGNLVMDDAAGRRQGIAEAKRKMRVAARLGAPLMRIHLGSTGRQQDDDTVGVDRAIAAFRELAPLARELHLRVAIENIAGVSWRSVNTIKIITATDPKCVGALIDFGNFADEVRYREIAALAPYALATHVKVNEFDARGEAATYDFPRVLRILKEAHYQGSFSIEYEGKGDRLEGVRKTKALLLKYW